MVLGAFLINIVYLSKRTSPLRYILPGTIFMLLLIVYPLFYTFYISLTNYGTGHVLSKQQVINQLESRYFLPDNPVTYQYTAFKKG